MPNNRDDFTEKTKKEAASRVGYRCSMPDCRCLTIGPSQENKNAVSNIGVAAHICAAARGGKRYDKEMTPEERKDISNCLWLCQTHAHLIDTDEKTYSVDILKSWKEQAEEMASRELANGKYTENYYSTHGEDLFDLESLLKEMVYSGNLKYLKQILKSYNRTLSEKYDECFIRYNIIWDTYCDRSLLEKDILEYLALKDKSGIDDIICLFLSFDMKKEINVLLEYSKDEKIIEFAKLAVENRLFEVLTGKENDGETIEVSNELKNVLDKYLLVYLCKNDLFGIDSKDGTMYYWESKEFFWGIFANLYFQINKFLEENKIYDSEIIFENEDDLLLLDYEVQRFIWKIALRYSIGDKDKFEKIYSHCPHEIQIHKSISEIYYAFCSFYKCNEMDICELMTFAEQNDDYDVVLFYVKALRFDEKASFLDEHQFLYKENSVFLFERIVKCRDLRTEDIFKLLKKYENLYREDFLYNCICSEYDIAERRKERIIWLKENTVNIDIEQLEYYLKILKENLEFEKILELSYKKMPPFSQYQVANYLSEGQAYKYIERSIEMYQHLHKTDVDLKWLHYNLACSYLKINRFEEAKREIENEYKKYPSDSVLRFLLDLRYKTKDFCEDVYFEQARHVFTPEMQNMVGSFYFEMGKYNEAKKYFLRSLLLNKNLVESMRGYFMASNNTLELTDDLKIKSISANTACTLSNDEETIHIALHYPDIINGFVPQKFANHEHFSYQDPKVAKLIYSRLDDMVEFNEKYYKVIAIEHIDIPLQRYALSIILETPETIKIEGTTIEESIKNLGVVLKEQEEQLKSIIDEFNNADIRYPLSIIAHLIGKNRIETWEYLMLGNKRAIPNNYYTPYLNEEKDKKYVLSYDSIISLVNLGIQKEVSSKLNLSCPCQVHDKILKDIESEIEDLEKSNCRGKIIYIEEKPRIIQHTDETKRERYRYLIKIKDFVESIPKEKACDFLTSNEDLIKAFSSHEIGCEVGALAVVQNIEDTVLVSDDVFLFGSANMLELENVGVIHLICICDFGWKKLIELSKKLKTLNFLNYLPFELYKTIVDSVIEDENCDEGSEMLFNWLQMDGDEPTTQHKEIIKLLFSDVYRQGEEYLNPNNILRNLALRFHESMYPGFLKSIIEKITNNLKNSEN